MILFLWNPLTRTTKRQVFFVCVCQCGACEAEFRSEVKCVNKSEEGGERVRVESASLRVCQSLVMVGSENAEAWLFQGASHWALACCWLSLLLVQYDADLSGSKAKRCWEDTSSLETLFCHKLLSTHCVVMGTVSELCASSFQAFLCPSVRPPAAATGKCF